jgi:hypothetical protein
MERSPAVVHSQGTPVLPACGELLFANSQGIFGLIRAPSLSSSRKRDPASACALNDSLARRSRKDIIPRISAVEGPRLREWGLFGARITRREIAGRTMQIIARAFSGIFRRLRVEPTIAGSVRRSVLCKFSGNIRRAAAMPLFRADDKERACRPRPAHRRAPTLRDIRPAWRMKP